MSIEGDLLFPQPDYFSELNHENVGFNEADFDKDLFGPAASGLSEHSQAPGGNYGGLVSDPLNLEEDHFLQSLGHHEELEVESKSSHSGRSNHESNPQGGAGAKQETPPLYGNGMVPMSSGPMFQYPGMAPMGGYVQQDTHPPSTTAATMEQFDRLALENQHMQQYQQQQELLQAQARQLQAQQQQLQSLQQAQFLYAQGQPPQPIVFLAPPRPGPPYLLPPRTGAPPVMYAMPHPVQMQSLPGGVAYHSAVAPIPLDQALNGKYYAPMGPPGATPLQLNPTPVHLNSTSMQLNPPPLQSPLAPLHVTAPVSPRVSGPMTPRSPHPRVKTEEGLASPRMKPGGRTHSGGDVNSGRASPPGDKKPPRSPTIPDQHTRPPLPTSHAVYMPVQYIQGGNPGFPRVASEDLLAQVDANGDVLRPLPPMQQRGGHGLSALQRSQSSHSLGQLQMAGGPPMVDATGMQRLETSAPYQIPNQGLGSMPVRQPSAMGAAGMRRVQSTGDIQSWNRPAQNGDATAGLHYDDFKVGRYTIEERKMRIQRYRQKRNERNYNKKIKYVCRKTLADSRPRIRGRFAKNDEVPGLVEAKKALEEEDDSSDFDEDMIIEEGGTELLGSADFDILEAERSLASLASAPATLSA